VFAVVQVVAAVFALCAASLRHTKLRRPRLYASAHDELRIIYALVLLTSQSVCCVPVVVSAYSDVSLWIQLHEQVQWRECTV
jgi:hypothetical protein